MKKFLTFLALACLMVTGAWAQTQVQAVKTSPAEGGTTYYFYTFESGAHAGSYWAAPNGTLNAQSSTATKWYFEPSGTENVYYVRDYNTGNYLASDGVNDHATTLGSEKSGWTIQIHNDGQKVTLSPEGHDDLGINWNDGHRIWTAAKNGNPGSWWKMFETVETISEKIYTVVITGVTGATVTYNNVSYKAGDKITATGLTTSQLHPSDVSGYEYTVNIEGETITIAYTALPLHSIDDIVESKIYTIQSVNRGYFVYDSNHAADKISGTARTGYTFSDTDANCQFVFLKHNDQTYLYSLGAKKFAAYGDPNVIASASIPEAGITMLPSTGGSKTTHPVVIAIDGSHQINMSTNQAQGLLTNWQSTSDDGNMLRILPVAELTADELAAIKEVFNNQVTITYTYKINDETVGSEEFEVSKGTEYPDPTNLTGYTYTKPEGTVSAAGSYDVALTWDGPFEFTTVNGSEFAEGTKWYYMQNGNNNGNGYVVYGNGDDKKSSMTTTAGTDDTYQWCFVRKTGSTAFYIYNKAAGAVALHEELSSDPQHPEWATNHNQGFCVAKTEGVNDMPLILRANNNGYSLQLAGEGITGTCLLGKHVNSYLSIWGNSANVTNDGCRFTFEEFDMNELIAALQEKVEEAVVQCNAVGYPSSENTAWQNFVAYSENWGEGITAANYDEAKSAYEAFKAITDVIMPEDGKTYVFKNVHPANEEKWILKENAGSLTTAEIPTTYDNSYKFVAHKVSDGVYEFTSSTGKYLMYRNLTEDNTDPAITNTQLQSTFSDIPGTFLLQYTYRSASEKKAGATVINVSTGAFDNWSSGSTGTRTDFSNMWRIEEVEGITPTGLEITIGETRYATFYDDVHRTIPAGINAYYCKASEDGNKLIPVKITLDYIPAYNGAILELQDGYDPKTYTFEESDVVIDYESIDWFSEPTNEFEEINQYNEIFGVTEDVDTETEKAEYLEDVDIYVLSKVNGQLGFYKYAGEKLAAHKAYYAASASAGINGFSLDFGGQTVGVNTVISATNLKAGFDIQGRKLNKMQKGINILNGKKIIK